MDAVTPADGGAGTMASIRSQQHLVTGCCCRRGPGRDGLPHVLRDQSGDVTQAGQSADAAAKAERAEGV